MKSAFSEWGRRMICLLRSPAYLTDLFLSAALLILLGWAYMYVFLAPIYGALEPNPIPDRLLAILPTVDLNLPSLLLILLDISTFGVWVVLRVPEKAPYVLKVLTIVFFAKHLIGPMTNLTQPLGAIEDSLHDNIYNDLFFSGHTGTSFAIYLLTRASMPRLKYFWLVACVLEAAVVLLMKLHYTIDVFAAPFIVYGLFVLSQRYLGRNLTAHEHLLPNPSGAARIG